MAKRVGGNLATYTWSGVAEGSGTNPPTLQVAEFVRWSMPLNYDVEDTTPAGADAPRFDMGIRLGGFIECEALINDGSSPGGMPRSPYINTSDGTAPTGTLRLTMDKNAASANYYEFTAVYCGLEWRGASIGGKKQRYVLRFMPTGSYTLVTASVTVSGRV